MSLLDRHLDAAELGLIQSLEIDQMSAVVHDGDDHSPVVLNGLRFSGGGDFLRDLQA
jgi:hypothetical protein